MSTALAVIDPKKIERLDVVAKSYALASANESPFGNALQLATAVTELRELLTPDIMRPIMALMNTPLGFLTDRDPKKTDKQGKAFVPYSEEEVKDVLIEGSLRGFYPAGNEMNIIASRFYGCKAGFRRKVTTYKGLTDFKDFYEVPRRSGEDCAVIKTRATWKLNGVDDALERDFAIRVNSGMGADAVTGKAERKLLKAVFDRISGMIIPDGEVDDAPLSGSDVAKSNAAKPVFAEVVSTTPAPAKSESKPQATTPAPQQSAPAPKTAPAPKQVKQPTEEAPLDPPSPGEEPEGIPVVHQVKDWCFEQNITERELCEALIAENVIGDSVRRFSQIKDDKLQWALEHKETVYKAVAFFREDNK